MLHFIVKALGASDGIRGGLNEGEFKIARNPRDYIFQSVDEGRRQSAIKYYCPRIGH